MTITSELLAEIAEVLTKHNVSWNEIRTMFVPDPNQGTTHPVQPRSALTSPVTVNGNGTDGRADVSSQWVKSAAEAILQSKARLTPNAQTFVAQTFARASQYDTVKFSPKQWEWFNKIMLSAGVEALPLEGNGNG